MNLTTAPSSRPSQYWQNPLRSSSAFLQQAATLSLQNSSAPKLSFAKNDTGLMASGSNLPKAHVYGPWQILSIQQCEPRFGVMGCGICVFCIMAKELAEMQNQIGTLKAGSVTEVSGQGQSAYRVKAGGELDALFAANQREWGDTNYRYVGHFDNSRAHRVSTKKSTNKNAFEYDEAEKITLAARDREWTDKTYTEYLIRPNAGDSKFTQNIVRGMVSTDKEHERYGEEVSHIGFNQAKIYNPDDSQKDAIVPESFTPTGNEPFKFQTFTLMHHLKEVGVTAEEKQRIKLNGDKTIPFAMGYLTLTKGRPVNTNGHHEEELLIYSTRELLGLSGPNVPIAGFLNAVGLALSLDTETEQPYQSVAMLVEPYQKKMMQNYFNDIETRLTTTLRHYLKSDAGIALLKEKQPEVLKRLFHNAVKRLTLDNAEVLGRLVLSMPAESLMQTVQALGIPNVPTSIQTQYNQPNNAKINWGTIPTHEKQQFFKALGEKLRGLSVEQVSDDYLKMALKFRLDFHRTLETPAEQEARGYNLLLKDHPDGNKVMVMQVDLDLLRVLYTFVAEAVKGAKAKIISDQQTYGIRSTKEDGEEHSPYQVFDQNFDSSERIDVQFAELIDAAEPNLNDANSKVYMPPQAKQKLVERQEHIEGEDSGFDWDLTMEGLLQQLKAKRPPNDVTLFGAEEEDS